VVTEGGVSQQVIEPNGFGVLPVSAAPSDLSLVGDHLAGAYVRYLKPAFDRAVGVVLSIVVLPLILIVALAVRIKLGPGVFFTQERVGLNGEPFKVYKFRTMHADRRAPRPSGEYAGPDRRVCHKRTDDPRHTPLGQFLRKTSLDELPQFWNVALGHMSLVGPRPELVSVFEEKYEPWQHKRHWVKPGVTGLWQISMRGDDPMYLHTEIDLEYVDSVSLWTDLRILARTVPSLVRRCGS
jgi:lipopolysaccharide/colanic/teichoic acid biosynthesis glycosyltransferase